MQTGHRNSGLIGSGKLVRHKMPILTGKAKQVSEGNALSIAFYFFFQILFSFMK
jgi:hypothetical protein